MELTQVKARLGAIVPTPYGMINDAKWVGVPKDMYIRRRLAEGDLILKTQGSRGTASRPRPKRRTA